MAFDTESRKSTYSRIFTENSDVYPFESQGYSVIRTMDGYRGPRLPGLGHKCEQVVRSVVPNAVGHSWQAGNYAYTSTGMAPISVGAVSGGQLVVNQTISVNADPEKLQALVNQMMGDIPTAVSIPNMIIEIPQTLALWTALAGPIKEFLKRGKKGTMREALRANANTSLATSFGALPLVADIQALWNLNASIRAARARALAVPMSWKRDRKEVSSVANYSVSIDNPSPSARAVVVEDAPIRRMWLTYRTKRNYIEDQYTAAAIATNLTGWNRPLEVLWEATPFSFVVDWFLPTGAILNQLNRGTFYGSMAVADLWTHSRATGSCTVSYDGDVARFSPYPSAKMQVWGRAAVKQYVRFPGLPTSVPMAYWPSVRQSYLGLSLILQKIL